MLVCPGFSAPALYESHSGGDQRVESLLFCFCVGPLAPGEPIEPPHRYAYWADDAAASLYKGMKNRLPFASLFLSVRVFTLLLLSALLPGQEFMAQAAFPADSGPVTYRQLRAHAQDLSTRPYTPAPIIASKSLRSLSYDAYRRINFAADAAIWRGDAQPFRLQMFHPGFIHSKPVSIHLIEGEKSRRLPFSADLFDYRDSPIDTALPDAAGFAGFRVHYPINSPDVHDEFLVFLGASYLRAVGRDTVYGLSARGLAVNTVGPGAEEFPRFSHFYIERPTAGCDEIVIHALLDSPSVTGAYRFTVTPGKQTRIKVDASLYPRHDSLRVGIAPLTSMFLFNSSNRPGFDDFRHAVHDSSGLQIQQADGERIWRPLANPTRVQVASFGAVSSLPRGFGLMQRTQAFDQFSDNEARYDKRPSLWIEPLNDWGNGRIELLEIPTANEYQDNIVAYWRPETGLMSGGEYRFRYRMRWGADDNFAQEPGRVMTTASGAGPGDNERLFVIDYSDGRQLQSLAAGDAALRVRATASAGEIVHAGGELVDATGRYRAYVRFAPEQAELSELRVMLEIDGRQWGETWLYRWTE